MGGKTPNRTDIYCFNINSSNFLHLALSYVTINGLLSSFSFSFKFKSLKRPVGVTYILKAISFLLVLPRDKNINLLSPRDFINALNPVITPCGR